MARIRSIKPEFFTSETIASLDPRARLTFIGLWTHADDHGRAIDNPRLITAAVWPLDDDVGFKDVGAHLDAFEAAGLICRYEHEDKQYLHITNWDEHQKPKNPSEPRFPACSRTSHGGLPPDAPRATPGLPQDFPASRARAEQGAGSREQGTASPDAETASTPRPLVVVPDEPAPTAQTLLGEHCRKCKARIPERVRGHLAREIKRLLDEGITPDAVRDGLDIVRLRGLNPSTLASAVNEALNPPAPRASPRKVAANGQPGADPIELAQRAAQRKRDEDEAERVGRDLSQAHRELPRPAAPADHA